MGSKRSRIKKRLQLRRAAERATVQQNEAAATAPRIANGIIVESRSDGSTPRREPDGAKKAHQPPSNGDIAINLLCPYQHPPGKMFEISHETLDQRALRNEIEISSFCRHLMERFAMEFLRHRNNNNMAYTPTTRIATTNGRSGKATIKMSVMFFFFSMV